MALAGSDGCSRQSKLADRIAGANRVIVLRRTAPHEAVSMAIEGKEVIAIIRAVSSATPNKARGGGAPPAFDDNIKIEFLKGSNMLAVLVSNEGVFSNDDKEYLDDTGRLSALRSASLEKWQPTSYEQYQRPR